MFLLLACCFDVYSECTIICRGRYAHLKTYIQPPVSGYYYGSEIGLNPLYGGGGYTYTSWNWSNTYNLKVTFLSGYEANVSNGNSIIAIVYWSNGGHSIISITNKNTNSEIITEEEMMNESVILEGTENDRKWELYLNDQTVNYSQSYSYQPSIIYSVFQRNLTKEQISFQSGKKIAKKDFKPKWYVFVAPFVATSIYAPLGTGAMVGCNIFRQKINPPIKYRNNVFYDESNLNYKKGYKKRAKSKVFWRSLGGFSAGLITNFFIRMKTS